MNTVDFDDTSLSRVDAVGVHRNRLVVTTRPIDYGTFAVTTDENWTTIPYDKATSFRLNNYTGKMIGVRRRHQKVVVDDFEDEDYSDWTGSVTPGDPEDGATGGLIGSIAHRPLTTEVMLDGSEVEITFKTPTASSSTTTIKIYDDANRIGVNPDAPSAVFTSSSLTPYTVYRVIFRLRPTTSEYDTFLESPGRSAVTSAGTGVFGANNMQESIISVECTGGNVLIDPIIYRQKVNWSNELMGHGSSFVYPCEDNISEYEVINLGSDALGYADNTQDVSLGGFYAV
jgi:hypothetical protein